MRYPNELNMDRAEVRDLTGNPGCGCGEKTDPRIDFVPPHENITSDGSCMAPYIRIYLESIPEGRAALAELGAQ